MKKSIPYLSVDGGMIVVVWGGSVVTEKSRSVKSGKMDVVVETAGSVTFGKAPVFIR